jgi:hypothetical protein
LSKILTTIAGPWAHCSVSLCVLERSPRSQRIERKKPGSQPPGWNGLLSCPWYHRMLEMSRTEERGSTTKGQIVSHCRLSAGRGGVVCYVRYQHECDRKRYTSEQMVSREPGKTACQIARPGPMFTCSSCIRSGALTSFLPCSQVRLCGQAVWEAPEGSGVVLQHKVCPARRGDDHTF